MTSGGPAAQGCFRLGPKFDTARWPPTVAGPPDSLLMRSNARKNALFPSRSVGLIQEKLELHIGARVGRG